MDNYHKWVEQFSRTPEGIKALAQLDKLDEYAEHRQEFLRLRHLVLHNCYKANEFKSRWLNDRAQEKRDFAEQASECTSNIRSILGFMRRYPDENMFSLIQSGVEMKLVDLENILELYATELKKAEPLPIMRAGPVVFAKSEHKNKGHIDITRYGLIFKLAFIFRHWTENKQACIHGTGRPMPNFGRPCHSLIDLFVNATLSNSGTKTRAKDALKRKDIKLAAWPK